MSSHHSEKKMSKPQAVYYVTYLPVKKSEMNKNSFILERVCWVEIENLFDGKVHMFHIIHIPQILKAY